MPNMSKRGGRERFPHKYYFENEPSQKHDFGRYFNPAFNPRDLYNRLPWELPSNHFLEHDNRDVSFTNGPDSSRRVSFKSHGSQNRLAKPNRQRGWDYKIRQYLADEEDVDMAAGGVAHASGDRFNPYQGSRNRRVMGRGGRYPRNPGGGSSNFVRRKLDSHSHWYRVTVLNGSSYEKDYLLKLIQSYVRPAPFNPLGFKKHPDGSYFYIDNYETADMINNADKRITTSDGWKLFIRVKPQMPFVEMDEALTAKLKVIMSRRYQPQTKALDLSSLYLDPELVREDLFVPLSRPNVMAAVIQILSESIPDLAALDISANKLLRAEPLIAMKDRIQHLRVLHMGRNKIQEMNHLECLRGMQLEELMLDGNPLCDHFTDQDTYVRAVRNIFPKVIKLDGANLEPPIVFDVDVGTLPRSQGSFLCDPEGGDIVRQFLEQYYAVFDATDRQMLTPAYHESAQLSLTCHPAMMSPPPNEPVSAYHHECRNLLRCNREKRLRLLKRGRLAVIDALALLPRTQHDPASFAVDLVLFSHQLIQLCVTGVFREMTSKKTLRSFNRTFIIVPAGSGFCIVNDLLFISNVTPEQSKVAFKVPSIATPVPLVPPTPSLPISPVVMPAAASVMDVSTRQQMVAALAQQSGMNLSWAEKCLNETNWEFERAVFVFSELNRKGTIPAEAFIK